MKEVSGEENVQYLEAEFAEYRCPDAVMILYLPGMHERQK